MCWSIRGRIRGGARLSADSPELRKTAEPAKVSWREPSMTDIVFKCPVTGMNVQHWLADVPDDEKDRHSSVVCLACTKTHFIHNSTGQLLGDDKSKAAR
jgi:hypothetical protein